MKKIFFSYSERSKDALQLLIADLKEMSDYELWIDRKLTGGQQWWNEILRNIRECDVFLFAMSPESLESEACSREYTYASQLGKSILPVMVADVDTLNLLPKELKMVQYIDYRAADKHAFMRLVTALDSLPKSGPLPELLPVEPEVPVSYIDELFSVIRSSDPMSFDQQASILVKLKEKLHSESERQDAIKLLEKLRERDDLYSKIGNQVTDILASEPRKNVRKNSDGSGKKAVPSMHASSSGYQVNRSAQDASREVSGVKNPDAEKVIKKKNRVVLFAALAIIVVLAGALYNYFSPGVDEEWPVAASDDFSALPCRWACGSASSNFAMAQATQVNGQYRADVSFSQPNWFLFPSPYAQSGDFYLEADVQIVSRTSQDASVGLFFRGNGNSYYVLRIGDSGKYALCYNQNGVFRDLITWTQIPNFDPFRMNRIGVLAEGTTISVFIDGRKSGEVQDSSSLAGATGFEVAAWNPMQVSVAFDNVVLTQKPLQGS